MLKEIFVQSYYPQVKEAGIKYGINPVVLLAQIAIETGWGESVLCKEHFNFGGLTGFVNPPSSGRVPRCSFAKRDLPTGAILMPAAVSWIWPACCAHPMPLPAT